MTFSVRVALLSHGIQNLFRGKYFCSCINLPSPHVEPHCTRWIIIIPIMLFTLFAFAAGFSISLGCGKMLVAFNARTLKHSMPWEKCFQMKIKMDPISNDREQQAPHIFEVIEPGPEQNNGNRGQNGTTVKMPQGKNVKQTQRISANWPENRLRLTLRWMGPSAPIWNAHAIRSGRVCFRSRLPNTVTKYK